MAKKTKTELLDAINALIGDRNDDAVISLLEDVTDTLDAYAEDENINYKQRYEENDKAWREKYISRFKGDAPTEKQKGAPEPNITPLDPLEAGQPPREQAIKINDLFTE